jgi:hypothetical protein
MMNVTKRLRYFQVWLYRRKNDTRMRKIGRIVLTVTASVLLSESE